VDVGGVRLPDSGLRLAGNVYHRRRSGGDLGLLLVGAGKDKPSQVNWLAESEKAALQEQLEREQQGIKPVRNYGEAFRSRNVVLLCMQYFAWSIGVYGFVLWLPSIIRSGGENMGMVEVGWLSSVPIWRRPSR
jgi:hypothetical protein